MISTILKEYSEDMPIFLYDQNQKKDKFRNIIYNTKVVVLLKTFIYSTRILNIFIKVDIISIYDILKNLFLPAINIQKLKLVTQGKIYTDTFITKYNQEKFDIREKLWKLEWILIKSGDKLPRLFIVYNGLVEFNKRAKSFTFERKEQIDVFSYQNQYPTRPVSSGDLTELEVFYIIESLFTWRQGEAHIFVLPAKNKTDLSLDEFPDNLYQFPLDFSKEEFKDHSKVYGFQPNLWITTLPSSWLSIITIKGDDIALQKEKRKKRKRQKEERNTFSLFSLYNSDDSSVVRDSLYMAFLRSIILQHELSNEKFYINIKGQKNLGLSDINVQINILISAIKVYREIYKEYKLKSVSLRYSIKTPILIENYKSWEYERDKKNFFYFKANNIYDLPTVLQQSRKISFPNFFDREKVEELESVEKYVESMKKFYLEKDPKSSLWIEIVGYEVLMWALRIYFSESDSDNRNNLINEDKYIVSEFFQNQETSFKESFNLIGQFLMHIRRELIMEKKVPMKFYLSPEDFFKNEFFRLKISETFEDRRKIYIFPEEDRNAISKSSESIINLSSEIAISKNIMQKMLEKQNLKEMIEVAEDFMKDHGKIYTSKYNTTVWRGDEDTGVLTTLKLILPKGEFELLKNPMEILPDSSCFYRSIAFSLFGTQDLCEHFRLSFISFLLINLPSEISEISKIKDKTLFIDFIKHNLKEGTWVFPLFRVLITKFIKRGLVSITDDLDESTVEKAFTYTKYSAPDKFTDIPICYYSEKTYIVELPYHVASLPSTYTQNQWDSFKNRQTERFAFEEITDFKFSEQDLKNLKKSVSLYAEGKNVEISEFWNEEKIFQ